MQRLLFPLLLVALGATWGAGCSREDSGESARTPASAHPAIAATKVSGPDSGSDFSANLPREGGVEGYVGSAACRSCHQPEFTSWHRTYHRTMTQFATPETVRANFHDQVLTNEGTRYLLTQAGDALNVRLERIQPGGPTGEEPAVLDTRVGLVTGSHHMQVFWMPSGDGNTQVGFPFTWLIPEQRWVPRNSTFIRPPEVAHSAEVWNLVCSRCHATAIEPRMDSARRTTDSRAAELGISCEACHGGGARHVAARQAAPRGAAKPDAAILRREIVQPEKIDPVRSAQICGFCHSMKWIDQKDPWRQNGFTYRPGDDLETTTPVIQPTQPDAIPGFQAYLATRPGLLDDFFWSDGMGRVSGREYNSLAASPCFKGGKFSCLSCHSLHESDPDDLLAANRTDNQACTQCHPRFREAAALQAHTHHRDGSSGSDCYNCHMPHTTYGVLTAIRSHQISNPRVSDQLSTGRPNACNLCHLDQTLEWTAKRLHEWYRQPLPVLDEAASTVADSVRLALAGDAGQRALMAWHFSWEPARAASATNWIPPVLGLLLDDSYAAVRCVAGRSLRSISGTGPKDYDYVGPPESRPAASLTVWRNWLAAEKQAGRDPATSGAVAIVQGRALEEPVLRPVMEALRQRRDPKKLRLRE
ncbi:MAG TPA: cytochrome c3 family protein [Candidatus Limnocylindria bacterium]|nr:cytochrome c3 family protein [Candidatus Limnocylindria bacterium]